MEKNQAVQNQKVFVTLEAIVKIARRYDVVCNGAKEQYVGSDAAKLFMIEKRVLEFIIETMSLPIDRRLASPQHRPPD
jgi:hypothetical protein